MKRRYGRLAALAVLLAGLAVPLRQLPHLPVPGFPEDGVVRADRIVVRKADRTLRLYQDNIAVRTYRIALGGGGLAPKRREGDRRTPEGLYRIEGRNPRSAYHLSLRISYPAARDIAHAKKRGVPPGSDIMIHGLPNGKGWIGANHRRFDWTDGCIAVTDAEIEEIWAAVPDGTPIEILP